MQGQIQDFRVAIIFFFRFFFQEKVKLVQAPGRQNPLSTSASVKVTKNLIGF